MDSREIISLMKLKSCPRRLGLAQANISGKTITETLKEQGLITNPFSASASQFATRQGTIFEAKITEVNQQGEAKSIESLYHKSLDWSFDKIYSKPEVSKEFLETVMKEDDSAILLSVSELPLQLTKTGVTNKLEADYLIWKNKQWTVGEIKAYSDMASLTDQSKVASATAQSALYYVALQNMGFPVSHHGHLIFQRQQILNSPDKPIEGAKAHDNVGPYYYVNPTLLKVSLDESIRAFKALQTKLSNTEPLEFKQALLPTTPFQLCHSCQSSCPLFEICQKEAWENGVIWNNQINLEEI